MQLGMVGLGRMGGNMVRRLMRDGHECVVTARSANSVKQLSAEGATGTADLDEFVAKLEKPRAAWVMVPAGEITEEVVNDLAERMEPGDAIIDGGNTYYHDDIRRAAALREKGIDYIDCGTSGGVFGLERGYCLMIGGLNEAVAYLDPLFRALAPGVEAAARTPGRTGPPSAAEQGYLHCGPSGAGHFVKMIHNGIEYGVMAAYAEGLNILAHADAGNHQQAIDAETTPLREPDLYKYQLDLPAISEVWRRGSVIASWLLDLTAQAFVQSADLSDFAGRVSDSGEGRWTSIAAIDVAAAAPVLTTALYARFTSRGESDFADKVLSAMRFGFGGHLEKKA